MRHCSHSMRSARSAVVRQRGVTILETAMAIVLFAVGSVAVLGTMNYALALDVTNRETALAMEVARNTIAEISAEPFETIVASFNGDVTDDPDGTNTAPGNTFNVAGLSQIPGVPVGEIVLPLDGSGDVVESLVLPELGLPRDLNGDGVTLSDAVDLVEDLLVLPVLVRIRWSGGNGERQLIYRTVVRR